MQSWRGELWLGEWFDRIYHACCSASNLGRCMSNQNPSPYADTWSILTRDEIISDARQWMTVTRRMKDNKEHMIDVISREGDPLLHHILTRRADARNLERLNRVESRRTAKRRRQDENGRRAKAARVEEAGEERRRELAKFLELPSDEEVKECYRQFYEATGNAALKYSTCGVCARELFEMDCKIWTIRLKDVPRSERLIPHAPHPDHDLYDGKLLQPEGVSTNEKGETMVNVCADCSRDLRSKTAKPPQLSLANNLWIGKIPWQILCLTFPEQMLVSLVFVRVYLFKLHTKNGNFQPDPAMLQTGLRGTVSTYPLETDRISDMLCGGMLPWPLRTLASVITIVFIGKGPVPLQQLRKTFRVRRNFVLDSLLWFIEHNAKHYGGKKIDNDIVQTLPIDDIPHELLTVMRQNPDSGLLDEQSGGYVPHRQDDEPDAAAGESHGRLSRKDFTHHMTTKGGGDASVDASVHDSATTPTQLDNESRNNGGDVGDRQGDGVDALAGEKGFSIHHVAIMTHITASARARGEPVRMAIDVPGSQGRDDRGDTVNTD
jgi:hypothetical protein